MLHKRKIQNKVNPLSSPDAVSNIYLHPSSNLFSAPFSFLFNLVENFIAQQTVEENDEQMLMLWRN